jgi:hypothetical protein
MSPVVAAATAAAAAASGRVAAPILSRSSQARRQAGGSIYLWKRGPPSRRKLSAETRKAGGARAAAAAAAGPARRGGLGSSCSEWTPGKSKGCVLRCAVLDPLEKWFTSGAKVDAEDGMYGRGRQRFGIAGVESPRWSTGGRLRLSLFHLLLLILQNAQPDAGVVQLGDDKCAWAKSHVAYMENPPRPNVQRGSQNDFYWHENSWHFLAVRYYKPKCAEAGRSGTFAFKFISKTSIA